ncbi:MAG: hypothetical protein K0Q97_409 [Bacillota bacterium]|nr:hypothetical protein [Bacillota bacterium]
MFRNNLNNNIFMQQQMPTAPLIADTTNTTRVNFDDMYNYNVAITNIVYPSPNVSWHPKAVIIVPSDTWQYGVFASSVVHFPINAPIFFTERNYMPPIILNEILRLAPTGENVPAQVLIVGPISQGIEYVLMSSGLSTYRITSSEDVYTACAETVDFRFNVVPSVSEIGKKTIMVISGQDYSEGICASFYAAHADVPIILVQQNSIPQVILNFLQSNKGKNFYIVGSPLTISESVEYQIRNSVTGNVVRIEGYDPISIAINFAKYQSPFENFGWQHNTRNGWGFTFGELNKWYHIVVSVLFAHLGKHTPLLLVESSNLPTLVRDYLISVNPYNPMSHLPPYMHCYILGSFSDISHTTQVEIETVTNIGSKIEHLM